MFLMNALPTNQPIKRLTNQLTDTDYYRDARTHLKGLQERNDKEKFRIGHVQPMFFFIPLFWFRRSISGKHTRKAGKGSQCMRGKVVGGGGKEFNALILSLSLFLSHKTDENVESVNEKNDNKKRKSTEAQKKTRQTIGETKEASLDSVVVLQTCVFLKNIVSTHL